MLTECCLCKYAIVKYTILCTVLERQKCVKQLPIQRVFGFSGFRWKFDKGGFRGVKTPVGAIFSYSSISGGKIQQFAWQNAEFGSQIFCRPKSKIAAHNKVEI